MRRAGGANGGRVLSDQISFWLLAAVLALLLFAAAPSPLYVVYEARWDFSAITLVAVAGGSIALLYAGSVVAGAGFGPAFSGIFRSLAPLAPPEGRGGLIASIYVVSYLAFSVPAVIAGVALTHWDLADTTYAYGAVLIVLAGLTAFAVGRDGSRASLGAEG